ARSGSGNLHAYDLEVDRTLYRLRNSRSNEVVNNSSLNCNVSASDSVGSTGASDPTNSVDSNSDLGSSVLVFSVSQFGLDNMENNDRTLKELATLDSYELKFGLIHLLPKFHGLVGEDSHKHLKEFDVVCSTMRPHGVLEDYIKMKTFPFSLDGAAKDWLYL
ncbi:hypothetical protein CR513_25322, partial [Mucuna pruriens]